MVKISDALFGVVAVFGVIVLLNGLNLINAFSIIGEEVPITCSRLKTSQGLSHDINCVFNMNYKPVSELCSPNQLAAQTFNYCFFRPLGSDFVQQLQSLVGEVGELTPDEKQSFYDNLELTGDCRLGYSNGVSKTVDGTCSYTSQFIDGKKYLDQALGCKDADLDRCTVTYINPSCGTPNGQPTGREEINVYFGNTNSPGVCGLKTKLPPKDDKLPQILMGIGLIAFSGLGMFATRRLK